MTRRWSIRGTLPLRRWLALALALGFVVPVFTTGVVAYHVIGIDREPGPDAAELLGEDTDRWTDPDWQAAASEQLTESGTHFVLMENGREVYRSTEDPVAGSDGGSGARTVETLAATSGGVERVAYIYSDPAEWTQSGSRFAVPIAGVTSLLLTLGGIAWFLGRMVVQPLGATAAAARQVASGDLDIQLRSSRVREVAEVNEAFDAMSAGLRESLESQSGMEQERRFLISSVAHDLRTPLFALRGYLAGLEQGVAESAEQRSHYLSVAQEKADALERMITDLSDFTRLEYLDQAPNREPVDLGRELTRLVEGMQPQASAKDVHLELELATPSCTVDADEHLLNRAIENLLDNAVRYTPSGGSVRVRCGAVDEHVHVAVEDTGPGIPDADLPHIFAPLYRGESSRNRRTGGSGLGLAIARRIVRAHGGELTAENAEHGGALFTCSLPSAPTR